MEKRGNTYLTSEGRWLRLLGGKSSDSWRLRRVVEIAENKPLTPIAAAGCTSGCTETADRVGILARAVELLAAMRLPVEEATAILTELKSQAR